jgi:hypothetical protein
VSVADGPSSSAIRSSATHATRGLPHSCARGPGDRDAAGLEGRAWPGRAAGRCRRGVTVLPSVARKTAQLS